MAQHIKILGYLFVAFGLIGIAFALMVFVFGAGAAMLAGAGAGNDQDAAAGALASGGCAAIGAALFGILSLPSLLAGWGLLKGRSWARILTIILAIFSLPGFPFGTAIGVYALWVMFNDETKRLLA